MIKKKTKEVEDAEGEDIRYRLQLREAAGPGSVIIFINPCPLPIKRHPTGCKEHGNRASIRSYPSPFGSNRTLSLMSINQYAVQDNALKS